jgi:hypothetical protein
MTASDPRPRERAVILLGRPRAAVQSELESELGVPAAVLPLGRGRTVLESWLEVLADSGHAWHAMLAIGEADAARFHQRLRVPPGIEVELVVDPEPDRGPAGVVRDLVLGREAPGRDTRARTPVGRVVVVEGSLPPVVRGDDLVRMLEAFGGNEGPGAIRIAVGLGAVPAGLFALDGAAVARISAVGFVDLKEQLVSAVVSAGGDVRALRLDAAVHRARDRAGYLAAVAARHARDAEAAMGAEHGASGQEASEHETSEQEATVHPSATLRGASLVAREGVVGEDALLIDSVVLPGARIGARAVVARSVVPPGVEVPESGLVVDEVFAALRTGGRK